LLFPSDTLITR